MIRRGTTPTNVFEVNLDLTDAEEIWLTYEQMGSVLFRKEKEDLEIEPEEVRVTLSQEETLSLTPGEKVEIQFRARFADGTAVASNIIETCTKDVLEGGVI